MTLQDLINRVRVYTRDFTGSIYREVDIDVFLREAFNRVSIIPELSTLTYPISKVNAITVFPENYQYLLSLYASSRCLFQDEQDYRAGTLMNEFETKLEELQSLIQSGDVIVKDTNGVQVITDFIGDCVTDVYFDKTKSDDEVMFD